MGRQLNARVAFFTLTVLSSSACNSNAPLTVGGHTLSVNGGFFAPTHDGLTVVLSDDVEACTRTARRDDCEYFTPSWAGRTVLQLTTVDQSFGRHAVPDQATAVFYAFDSNFQTSGYRGSVTVESIDPDKPAFQFSVTFDNGDTITGRAAPTRCDGLDFVPPVPPGLSCTDTPVAGQCDGQPDPNCYLSQHSCTCNGTTLSGACQHRTATGALSVQCSCGQFDGGTYTCKTRDTACCITWQ